MTAVAGDGLLVGIEIHQQLDLRTKLFCACPPVKSDEFPNHFERRLRPAQSETGRVDPAAVFEYSKGKSNMYFWSPESSCLVEADEEPPHPLSPEGLDAALLTAQTLGAKVVDEVHVMRKIVIDGSNTAGFQRTAVVGLGGALTVDGIRVGVQSVTIEEDAARILGEDETSRKFALDRLGVALVEVALDPISGDPEFVGRTALHLGRVLRSTGKVARGLGTIRQDLNISLMGGKVVEVKGVQKLNLVPKVVEYERRRQRGLVGVASRLKELGVGKPRCATREVSSLLAGTASKALGQQLSGGGSAVCISVPGFAGLVGWEPEPGVRLGRELAEVARASSLGGIIHSDEFEKQGISKEEEEALRSALGAGPRDALIIVAGARETVRRVVGALIARVQAARDGVPAETRAATEGGETRYMRPRPGSQRMYPETDIPNRVVTQTEVSRLAGKVPQGWEARVKGLSSSYGISGDLALKLYDGEEDQAFESLCRRLKVEPSVIASTLVDLPARLVREGVPEGSLVPRLLEQALEAVSAGRVSKEAIPDIVKGAATKGEGVDEVIKEMGFGETSADEVRSVLRALVSEKVALIREKRESAFSLLMGEAMKQLRGRADGSLVARILKEEIEKSLR